MTDGRNDSAPADFEAVRNVEPFTLPIEAIQPSQLYLNGRKLALVTEWFDFAEPNYDPLPLRRVTQERGDETWMLTDGHTRAFVAHLAGADELRVVRDTDDLLMGVYRQCVEWCEDEGVTEVGDLAGRVLNADEFEARWVERCQEIESDE
jgi:hypothetical protein